MDFALEMGAVSASRVIFVFVSAADPRLYQTDLNYLVNPVGTVGILLDSYCHLPSQHFHSHQLKICEYV
jgi:hypothetical protein